MANKRITQLPTAPQVEDNDYIALDNTSTPTAENEGGTRKILAKDVMAKSADAVEYDNTSSGLEADNVQDAIDEVLEEGGKVQDVYENGVSVVDPTDKIARIHGHKEVTQAEYDALPSSKLTDGILYCIKDSTFSASDVPYDNSDSGLASEDVQSAVDEIADVLGALKVEGTIENTQIATFTDGSSLPMPKLEIAVEPQQSGSGDPSPENIRPISGWDEVDVNVSGVNVWDEEWEKGALSNSTGEPYLTSERIRSKNFIPTKPNTAYYFYEPNTYSSTRVACYDKDKTYLGQSKGWLNVSNNTSFITPNNTYYIKFVVVKADETYDDDISINYPSTDTEYHAYNPNSETITIQLGDTYYGAKLDVVSGVLTVDRAYVDLGTLNWSYIPSSGRSLFTSNDITDYKHTGSNDIPVNAISECFKIVSMSVIFQNGQMGMDGVEERNRIIICDNRYTDATSFKTAMSGVQLVYELATPIEIQLTPTQVNSLEGVNNISANSGKINKAVYIRDLNIVINNLLNG